MLLVSKEGIGGHSKHISSYGLLFNVFMDDNNLKHMYSVCVCGCAHDVIIFNHIKLHKHNEVWHI